MPALRIPPSKHYPYRGWADSGGLSEAISEHLVSFVFPEGEPG
tara:strand:- start:2081 stop:2209 length:129 start_codon:yes stop_codon:yes gene_type:complete